MLKKLRIKFICIMMSIVTVMMCVIMGFVIGFTHQDLVQERETALQSAAMDPGFLIDPRETESSLPYFIIQRDSRGNLRVRGTVNLERFDEEQLQAIWNLADGSESGILREYRLEYRFFSGPLGERYVFVDISSHQRVIGGLVRVCFAVGTASLLAFLGVSILLARWAVRPVEKAWEEQRRFVADASHELKTPLTVIMTNADLLQSGNGDAEAAQRSVSSIVTMSHQMRALVEGLLELARVDNGAVRANFTQTDLSGLVSDSVLIFEPMFFERDLTLESRVGEGISLKASPQHLRQVVEILLDNALKYSSSGGVVGLSLQRQGTHCHLWVASPGDPISPEDQKKIFQRFYRVDRARSRDGSYGLGLSIAQQIVLEHGGKIWAESRRGFNYFHVQLSLN